ncbi:MAG: hypothetical protein M1286_01170 [Candidatus Marsarchaeota archaeon]|nr:hypothetical protein [Candidatus Marsarchaeota archaeon]
MRKGVLVLLLSLAALAGIPSAASACLLQAPSFPAYFLSTTLLALTISVDVLALGYIISKILPGTGVGEWLDKEYWEFVKTVMLVAGIFLVLVFMGNIATLFVPPGYASSIANQTGINASTLSGTGGIATVVNGACYYLQGVQTQLGSIYDYLFGMSSGIGILQSTSFELWVPLPIPPVVAFKFGFALNPYQNSMLLAYVKKGDYQSILDDAITLLAFPVTLLVALQQAVLPSLFLLGLFVLLPTGLIMRSLPFIRGVGGTLIAIAIGISIIYPAVLLALNYPVTSVLASQAYTPPEESCGGGLGGLVCGALNAALAAGESSSNVVGALTGIYGPLNGIMAYNSYLILQLVLFILDLGITLPLIDSIAKMLGGTIRLSLGGKLKLV